LQGLNGRRIRRPAFHERSKKTFDESESVDATFAKDTVSAQKRNFGTEVFREVQHKESQMKRFSFALVALLAATAFTAKTAWADSCSACNSKDIVDTAVGADGFDTLVAAVKAAGLVETLKGDGPFTVFAPTDDAFAKLPEGTLSSLLKPENKDKLTAILTYHVVPGRVLAADVVKLTGAKTVQGSSVKIAASEGGVKVDAANVVKTDICCKNGVIHVIDSVILPN
jgi:uncharacterized surface protein with fasciclin (FAS1) repeats